MKSSSPASLPYSPQNIRRDVLAGAVTFLVSLPLSLGVAFASGAPLMSGLVAGIIGGLVVGMLSASHTSISGPAAGLAAIVLTQLQALGSIAALALAVVLAGCLQLMLGWARAGFVAAFFPSTVVRGLMSAIGLLLILTQLPHLLGHDLNPLGELRFFLPTGENSLSDLMGSVSDLHFGAAIVGLVSLTTLVTMNRIEALKKLPVPPPIIVVVIALLLKQAFKGLGEGWTIGPNHLVQIPTFSSFEELGFLLPLSSLDQLARPALYVAALTIAVVASLETLLNLEAIDKLDPYGRRTPRNRELLAQGTGNILSGLLGGLPITSVLVRSSVNINAGNRTRLSTIVQGTLLLLSVFFLTQQLNEIPLAALAAILVHTGFLLANPQLFVRLFRKGWDQFLPFIITVLGILLVDLLPGIVIGLLTSVHFILYSNYKRPLHKVLEHHVSEDVLRIQLSNQVSFLQKAALAHTLAEIAPGSHVLIDARQTDYIDPDVLSTLQQFRAHTAPAKNIDLSLVGFKDRYKELDDQIQFVDYSSRDLQHKISPEQVVTLLKQGNDRFKKGQRLERDLLRQVEATAPGQAPLAVVLSCIDSRAPAEIVFDLGIGDIFNARIAGNVARGKILGSMEYGCKVAGAKVLLVMGHTSCGAVTAAVDLLQRQLSASEATGCANLDNLIDEIQASIDRDKLVPLTATAEERKKAADVASKDNVLRTMSRVRALSPTLTDLLDDGSILMLGGLYHVASGQVDFFDERGSPA